jgi:hypothetical protein
MTCWGRRTNHWPLQLLIWGLFCAVGAGAGTGTENPTASLPLSGPLLASVTAVEITPG